MKKAQEEMVGFVLIVVIVVIIAVIFLGISLRQPSTQDLEKSEELNSFLSSISEVTSECEIPRNQFRSIGELIINCYEQESCRNDDRFTCLVLEETLKNIMQNSTYNIDKNSYNQYYILSIYSGENENKKNLIPDIHENAQEGNCLGSKIYNYKEFTTKDFEKIYFRLEVCYKD